jgi:threonyl-tRNA synthetase
VALPINDALTPYALEVKGALEQAGLRTEVDSRTESLNKKIRGAQLSNIPLILTIGAKEQASNTLSVRTLDGKVKMGVLRDEFIQTVSKNIAKRALDLPVFA